MAILPLLFRRRATCHLICWMAPFMIIGTSLARVLNLPHLHITTKAEQCIHCGRCTSVCSMSLSVEDQVKNGSITDLECIMCMNCADNCPTKAIQWHIGSINSNTTLSTIQNKAK